MRGLLLAGAIFFLPAAAVQAHTWADAKPNVPAHVEFGDIESPVLAQPQITPGPSVGFTRIGNVAVLTFTDAAVVNQTSYGYQVTATDSTGLESVPATCGPAQLCFGGNIAVAVMPSSGTHTVTLSWAASTSPNVTYNIYRHAGPLPPSGATATVN